MAVGIFFLSAAPTAQNSPELHVSFINSFIQLSLVGSLMTVKAIVHSTSQEEIRSAEKKNLLAIARR